jgi:hypothetical protein
MYTGGNSDEILAWVLDSPMYTPENINVTIASESDGVLTLHFDMYSGTYVADVPYTVGDWVIRSQQGPGSPSDVIPGTAVTVTPANVKQYHI